MMHTHWTKIIYTASEQQDVPIGKHAHDNNASISKYVREEHPTTMNQLDNWHARKQLEMSPKTISEGPKNSLCITWGEELINKHLFRTHAYHALKNCGFDAETLKSMLQNSIKHYKGNHANCFPGSRCKGESLYYESRRRRINDPLAENVLWTALEKSIIIRKAELFVHKMSTASAEFFQ